MGEIRYHHDFPSRFVAYARTISVWLPPDYDLDAAARFPTLYMHDGQNLFDPQIAFGGHPWFADKVAASEIHAGRVRPLIIVGIANTPDRISEYGPRESSDEDRSHDYGRFVVEEVKPFIDATYRTHPGPANTGIAGSSMGGLISLALCQRYPDVFGRCAALSPSLWWDRESFLRHATEPAEWLARCRVWADMGTREGGSEAGMRAMTHRLRRLADLFARHGAGEGQFHVEEVEGGTHNEAAWGDRFDRVLRFLFGTE